MSASRYPIGVQQLRTHLDGNMGGLRVDRYSWWVHWRDVSDYLLPYRYKWLITTNQANRGSPINQKIIDNTGTIALRVMAAGMMAGITSPGRPWFRLTLDNKDLANKPGVKLWLAEVTDRMLTVFAESNFYNALATMYLDLGWCGTAPLTIYEDFDDVIRCYNWACGEYYLANNERMQIDTGYREFVMTVKQMVQKFGIENCSPDVQGSYRTGQAGLSREKIVCHAIEPNDPIDDGSGKMIYPLVPKSMPYREVYWEQGSDQTLVLSARGFHEFPLVAPRWDIVGNSAYGRCPGMDALGDVKQLQLMQKRKAQGIDKQVNPPLVADTALRNEPASVLPGGVTYVANAQGVGMKPVYEVKPDLQYMIQDMQEIQGRIKTTFFNDLFMMISQLDTVRTATEIDARREEKLIQLGPVLERFMNEALDPAIDRVFNIMLRARVRGQSILPPIPPDLRGQHIKTEYISMLAQAQKAALTAGIERLNQMVGALAGSVPDVLDLVDFDEEINEYADLLGVSPKIMRPIAQVMKIRQQKAQAMAAQQQGADAMAAVQGAQTLSKTDVGGGINALQAMAGGSA